MADSKSIFIVEDDVDLAEMLIAYFRAQNYRVSTTTKGEDAIRLITEAQPDIILLDIRLPDIDGYEVCSRLRRSRHTRHVPVIFLTERRERDYRLAGLELGAVDYITKPFDIHELRLRIRNILRRNSLKSLQNTVTGLPEGMLVYDRVENALDVPAWALVVISIRGLSHFRDQYGFVAADDVTRAVSLMITNAMQESGAEEDFVGHLGVTEFVTVTRLEQCNKIAGRCRMRLEPSIQYFYPAIDRQRIARLPESERLSIKVVCLKSNEGDYPDLDAVREGIRERLG